MKILIDPVPFMQLHVIEAVAENREFSGYGFVEVEERKGEQVFRIYDIELLDIGSTGYTEFDSRAILEVLKREDSNRMKCWFHRHPLGSGKPGPENWSQTDENTCVNEPLGCPDPMKVKWALAIVLTPKGWVGRLDQFKDGQHKTTHLPVEANIDWSIVSKAKKLLKQTKAIEKKSKNGKGWSNNGHKGQTTVTVRKTGSKQTYTIEDLEEAHACLDDGFQMVKYAEMMIQDAHFQDAMDMVAWAYDVAQYYKGSAYAGDKARRLLSKSIELKRQLRKELVVC